MTESNLGRAVEEIYKVRSASVPISLHSEGVDPSFAEPQAIRGRDIDFQLDRYG